MARTDLRDDIRQGAATPAKPPSRAQFTVTFVDSSSSLRSILRQIRQGWREPKITVPQKYYRGEVRLPITEMRSWFTDLPTTLRIAFERPRDPIGRHNRKQTWRRALLALAIGAITAGAMYYLEGQTMAFLGAVIGIVAGEIAGLVVLKNRAYPPDIFQDYRQQAASWVNSILVHALALAALTLPFILFSQSPVKAAPKSVTMVVSPYLPPDLAGPAKKSGGGGGGGDRTPTPPSKGAAPKFDNIQLAPPRAKIVIPNPQIPVQPTLLGPPELKLPQMANNSAFGDPQGVVGPPSNGPGTGGGIGTGTGTGIGPGNGAGLGPGDTAGYGGGAYSVGGGVTAPVVIYGPEPPYSEEARKAKYQGVVVLLIVVGPTGLVSDVRVIKPLGLGLDEKAVQTVKTWKFKPGERNGTPVPVRMSVEVTFRLF